MLIKRFAIILRTINSGYEINVENFEKYCLKTAERYVEKYNWYYMPTSVHKLLIHGAVTVKYAIVPIGELSEEAQEAKNKDIKRYRLNHTRKISALKVNEDLFSRLILSSDPYLSSFSCGKKKIRHIDEEMRHLIIIPESEAKDESEEEEEEEYVDEEESEIEGGFETEEECGSGNGTEEEGEEEEGKEEEGEEDEQNVTE